MDAVWQRLGLCCLFNGMDLASIFIECFEVVHAGFVLCVKLCVALLRAACTQVLQTLLRATFLYFFGTILRHVTILCCLLFPGVSSAGDL